MGKKGPIFPNIFPNECYGPLIFDTKAEMLCICKAAQKQTKALINIQNHNKAYDLRRKRPESEPSHLALLSTLLSTSFHRRLVFVIDPLVPLSLMLAKPSLLLAACMAIVFALLELQGPSALLHSDSVCVLPSS
jgi:hypothetical protein